MAASRKIPTTDVQIKERPDLYFDDQARIVVVVPLTGADNQWVRLFNAVSAETDKRVQRSITADSDDVVVIAILSGLTPALNQVRELIEQTNLARKRLEEQADEYAAKVNQWWADQAKS